MNTCQTSTKTGISSMYLDLHHGYTRDETPVVRVEQKNEGTKELTNRGVAKRRNVLIFSPHDWGMLRMSRCVQTFL